ncbi:NAD(P)/FAD-dependent oxidoreductase [Advenella mimigardefordensis]|uniref:Putative FAD-dependent oxidoreductase n=1 Tax=Advenella mimigardefordensis (strain DSM 17166 / LMG 22922 / DPN7) TaxID=1247726 RepID=W0PFR8_ADVMD|nr:FAD-binding oxidoreductase [Advenella mimigardefordensis]AHG65526.1 putative FAD-dependent oxidoreductase [Advenella mimigardefordensis DPN7]
MSSRTTYPVYESRSGWNALLPARTAKTAIAIEKKYDFIVIGAGYTGLAAARRLAELNSSASILVLEAGIVGEGSSARNSGFVIALPHNTNMSGHISPAEIAQKQIRVYDGGLRWLKGLVDTHQIDCGWNPQGKYHGAATEEGAVSLQNTARQYDKWGVEYQEISQTQLSERLGTRYYRFAIQTNSNVFMQPAALIRGLADHLPANVTLLENCPVLSVEQGREQGVRTARGLILGAKIIVANNGFARKLGFLKDRMFTIFTYAAITPELDPEQLALHGSEPEWGLIPANRMGTTLRKIQNKRFMVRSAYSYEKPQTGSSVLELLTDCYRRRYPAARSHQFEHLWGGVTALTRNGATYFGEMAPNLYASVGCNGAGVLKGTCYGKLLAELILGHRTQELADVLAMEKPSWLPPEPLRGAAVKTAIYLQKRKAGAER